MHCMLRIMRQEVKCLSQKYNLSCHQEDSIITRALKQLKIIPCPSSFHFLAVLDKLERDSVTNFPTLNACIIVDDLSAHMHVDRVGFGFNKPYSSGRSSTESSTQSSYQNMKVVYASILRKLNNLQQMLEAPIIMTTRMRTELSSGQGSRRAKLQPWDEEVTHVIQILPARDEEESSSVTTMQWLKPFSTSVERLSLLK